MVLLLHSVNGPCKECTRHLRLLRLLLISDLIEISFSDEEEERKKVAPKKELMVLVNSGEGEATVLDHDRVRKRFPPKTSTGCSVTKQSCIHKTYPHGRDISPVCGAQKGRREPNKKPDGGGAYNDF